MWSSFLFFFLNTKIVNKPFEGSDNGKVLHVDTGAI